MQYSNVFVPATIGKQKYVDGGLVSPIPVKTARDMGADIVIAVDISARPQETDLRICGDCLIKLLILWVNKVLMKS